MGEGALHSGGSDSRERSIERSGPSVKRHVHLDARAPHGCIHFVILIICSNMDFLRCASPVITAPAGRDFDLSETFSLLRGYPYGVST